MQRKQYYWSKDVIYFEERIGTEKRGGKGILVGMLMVILFLSKDTFPLLCILS